MRRVDASAQGSAPSVLERSGVRVLPNTAGCFTARDAVVRRPSWPATRPETDWVKLEVIGDDRTLLPDTVELLAWPPSSLLHDGFVVLAYTNDDPIVAIRLERLGCAGFMPLGAPIGSGWACNPYNLAIIRDVATVPNYLDAGIGTASDAAIAMELGCDAVLLASAVTRAQQPARMAEAMRKGVEAGRLARLAGRIPRRLYASASSPTEGLANFGNEAQP